MYFLRLCYQYQKRQPHLLQWMKDLLVGRYFMMDVSLHYCVH